MARAFSNEEARYIIRTHRSIIRKMETAAEYHPKWKSDTANLADSLNRKHTFSNMLSKDMLSGKTIENIPFDVQQLIIQLFRYIIGVPLSDDCKQLMFEKRDRLLLAISNLSYGIGSIKWIFISKENKQKVHRAYRYLCAQENGNYGLQARRLISELQALETPQISDVVSDFKNNLAEYKAALYECDPKLFSSKDDVRCIQEAILYHEATLSELENAKTMFGKREEAVVAAASRLITLQVGNLLKEISVDELSREKSGIRIKSLHDSGYDTIADIYGASIWNLESIYGISYSAAYTIHQCAKRYAEQLRVGVKINLSIDNQTIEATNLVCALYSYRQRQKTVEAIDVLLSDIGSTIKRSISDLKTIKNGVVWLFTEVEVKQSVISSYQRLVELMRGDFGHNANELIQEMKSPDEVNSKRAWMDFSVHSIEYFQTLESIVPGLLGNDDSLYGLPEDLAREIQDESFFPDGLKCTLRRYQEWGVKYILHQERVLLGDEMGLGKTVQAIAAMVSLRNTGATHFLVVCPASILPNWCREILKKSKLRVTKIHGTERMKALEDWLRTGGVAVTTYETTSSLELDSEYSFDMLIVDEAHYIKNPNALRSKYIVKLSGHTNRVLLMTGTALENRVDEMIVLIQLLRPNVASQIREISFMSTAPQFREKVAPVYYRRKRDNVLTELPELIETQEWCSLSAYEESLYENTVLSKNYAETRRVSWNIGDLQYSCKARRMCEIIEDATEDNRKVIVFSFFLETIKAIHSYLGHICMTPITGSVPPQRRQEILDEFDKAPAGTVLISQIQSGGIGLNIQAASTVIICEPQFKPSTENQAISRAYRMGQTRNVLVYRLLCENTVDERITEMLADKQAIFNAFADKSVSAIATEQQEAEMDDKTFGTIIKEEIDRINTKRRNAEAEKVQYG